MTSQSGFDDYRISKVQSRSQLMVVTLLDLYLFSYFFLEIKVFNKLQVFHFRSTVHTNTTPTVITHSCVLQKPPFCNDNGYKFELKKCRANRHVSQFLAKKSEMLKL